MLEASRLEVVGLAEGRLMEETVAGRLRVDSVEVVRNWDVEEIVDVLANRVVDVENSSIVLVCVDVDVKSNVLVSTGGADPSQTSPSGQQPITPFVAITQTDPAGQ